jgi:hypothetical protein
VSEGYELLLAHLAGCRRCVEGESLCRVGQMVLSHAAAQSVGASGRVLARAYSAVREAQAAQKNQTVGEDAARDEPRQDAQSAA